MKRLAFCLLFMLAAVELVPSLACTTAIISAEASGTGRPLLWKHRDTDEYFNHIEHLKGEKYSYTALLPILLYTLYRECSGELYMNISRL